MRLYAMVRAVMLGSTLVVGALAGCAPKGLPYEIPPDVVPPCTAPSCTPVVLASGQDHPFNVALDGTSLYWTNSAPDGAIMKVSLIGGAAAVLASGEHRPGPLVVDSSRVYWTSLADGEVRAVALAGGTVERIAENQPNALCVQVDAATIYWSRQRGAMGGDIMRVPIRGGLATPLATAQDLPLDLILSGDTLYYLTSNLTMDGGSLSKIPIAGAEMPTGISTFAPAPVALVADATSVYFTDSSPGTVTKIGKSGGASITLATAYDHANEIAIDATHVYWTSQDGGAVLKVAKAGGKATVLAIGQARPYGIAVDATSVYWANLDSGTVMKVGK